MLPENVTVDVTVGGPGNWIYTGVRMPGSDISVTADKVLWPVWLWKTICLCLKQNGRYM